MTEADLRSWDESPNSGNLDPAWVGLSVFPPLASATASGSPPLPEPPKATQGAEGFSEFLRFLAIARDASAGADFELGWLWRDLCAGRLEVFDTFFADERCYALMRRAPRRPGLQVRAPKSLQILERVLLGERPKALAFELGIAPSTVAVALSKCLRALGVDCRPAQVPLLFVMAARGAHGVAPFRGRIAAFESGLGRFWVVSASRPDRRLAERLSSAEYSVAQHLVEGQSHAQISRLRGTSVRTVANQLGAAFRKLGVSGRCELIDRALAG